MQSVYIFGGVTVGVLLLFILIRTLFCVEHKGAGPFFFDPQDCFYSNPTDRVLPLSAKTATFEPFLKHYIGVTQLLVTVAAASIAFGGRDHKITLVVAKLILAWSIFFGLLFCALLLWRYDEYAQDMKSYTLPWYSTIFACGFSSLFCFMIGYLVWGFGLI